MPYFVPLRQNLSPRRLRGLSLIEPATVEQNPVNGSGPFLWRVRPRVPLPVAPKLAVPPTSAPPTLTTAPTAPTGYCIFTSSPQTGGVVSVAQCTAAPGGVPVASGAEGAPFAQNPAPAPTVVSAVPSTWPTNQPYTDSTGNIWTYSAFYGWQVTGNVSSALAAPASGSSVVPAGWPTNQPYTDASGNVWIYTGSGWQISQLGSSAPASSAGAGVSVSPSTVINSGSASYQSVIDWLNSQSLINGVSNFWIVGGAVGALFLIKNRGGKR